MQHEAFLSGQFDTGFIERYFKPDMLQREEEDELAVAAYVATHLQSRPTAKQTTQQAAQVSNWKKQDRVEVNKRMGKWENGRM